MLVDCHILGHHSVAHPGRRRHLQSGLCTVRLGSKFGSWRLQSRRASPIQTKVTDIAISISLTLSDYRFRPVRSPDDLTLSQTVCYPSLVLSSQILQQRLHVFSLVSRPARPVASRQSPVAPVDISFKFPRFIFEFRYRTRKDGPKINEPFERRERLGSSHKDCTADMKPSLRTVCIRHQLPLTSESRSIGECRSAISDPADERTRTRSWPS